MFCRSFVDNALGKIIISDTYPNQLSVEVVAEKPFPMFNTPVVFKVADGFVFVPNEAPFNQAAEPPVPAYLTAVLIVVPVS